MLISDGSIWVQEEVSDSGRELIEGIPKRKPQDTSFD